eukprot:SAG22_NODE_858_length_6831_cov_25.965538_4_plen_99_part_00
MAATLGDIVRTFKEGSPFAPWSDDVHEAFQDQVRAEKNAVDELKTQLYKAREEQRQSHKNLKQVQGAKPDPLADDAPEADKVIYDQICKIVNFRLYTL